MPPKKSGPKKRLQGGEQAAAGARPQKQQRHEGGSAAGSERAWGCMSCTNPKAKSKHTCERGKPPNQPAAAKPNASPKPKQKAKAKATPRPPGHGPRESNISRCMRINPDDSEEEEEVVVDLVKVLALVLHTGLAVAGDGNITLQVRLDAKLAQKLGQLQPYIAVFPHECMGQLAAFGPT